MAEGRGGNFLKPFLAPSLFQRTSAWSARAKNLLKKLTSRRAMALPIRLPPSSLAVALNRGPHFMGLSGIAKQWTEFIN